jgi:hypothetical protein
MKRPRRKFLRLAAGAAVLPVFSRGASAVDYPVRPLRPPSDGSEAIVKSKNPQAPAVKREAEEDRGR